MPYAQLPKSVPIRFPKVLLSTLLVTLQLRIDLTQPSLPASTLWPDILPSLIPSKTELSHSESLASSPAHLWVCEAAVSTISFARQSPEHSPGPNPPVDGGPNLTRKQVLTPQASIPKSLEQPLKRCRFDTFIQANMALMTFKTRVIPNN